MFLFLSFFFFSRLISLIPSSCLSQSFFLSRVLYLLHSVVLSLFFQSLFLSLFLCVFHTPFLCFFFLLVVVTISRFITSFFDSERFSRNVVLDTCLKLQGIIAVYPDMLYGNEARCLWPLITECQTQEKWYSIHSIHRVAVRLLTLKVAVPNRRISIFRSPQSGSLRVERCSHQKFTLSCELWTEHMRIF
jgi:hypothetical protein